MTEYTIECPTCHQRLTLRVQSHAGATPIPAAAKEDQPAPPTQQATLTPSQDLAKELAPYADRLRRVDLEHTTEFAFKKFMPGPDGTALWAQVNEIMERYGGKWFKAGKQSHWEVPVTA